MWLATAALVNQRLKVNTRVNKYSRLIPNSTDMMINKDNQEMIADEDLASKDGQIYYIPRVASGNGKRGAILSWALPANRV